MTLHIRLARPDDTPGMLDITRPVWEGHDYVPRVWNRWLRNPNGALFVAELSGRVVGLQHVALHPDGSAWLEGIRVAERTQGRGVGHALLAHGVSWARDAGCPAVRLSTSDENPSSNRIAEKGGFEVVAVFHPMVAAMETEPGEGRLALPSDFPLVYRVLERFGAKPFYTEGWTAYHLTPTRLAVLLAMHSVVLAGGDDAVLIATSSVDTPALRIGLAAGQPDRITDAARWTIARARKRGLAPTRAAVDTDEPTIGALEAAGFGQEEGWHAEMLLHELRLGSREAAASPA